MNTKLDKVEQILCNLIQCGNTEEIFQKRVFHICSFVLGLPLAGYIAHTGDADDSDGSIPPSLLFYFTLGACLVVPYSFLSKVKRKQKRTSLGPYSTMH